MPPLAHRSLLLASLSANPGLRLRARRLPRSVAMSQMSCRHLLIKFSGSRNPVSRRTGESTASVTAEDALHELEEHAKKIRAEGSTEAVFAKYATQRSDCGSYAKGGDLGAFGPGMMQSQFEEGTKATPVGAMSPPVLSDSGYHLIFRTA